MIQELYVKATNGNCKPVVKLVLSLDRWLN